MKKNYKFKDIIKYPLTICFTVFILLVFILYFVIPDKEKSEWENRYLAQRPQITLTELSDGSFMTKYEDYINDQIPFRDGFIKLKAVSEAVLLKLENNGIARGKDSYLFTKNTGNTEVFDKNISIIDTFVQSIDNPVTIALAPNACGVISDAVPSGFPNVNQEAKLNEFYGDNSLLSNARVVNLLCALKAHEDEYIYYRTDHHWTTLGAYYAYCEIFDDAVEKSSLSESNSDEFLGTLYAKYKGLNVKADTITYYDIPVKSYKTDDEERDGLYDFDKLSVFDKYGMFMWGNFGRCDIKTNTENGRSAVVFKDSYANSLIPFMTYNYEYITVIDLRYYAGSVKELMEESGTADVLFIYNFDFMNEDNHFYKLMK